MASPHREAEWIIQRVRGKESRLRHADGIALASLHHVAAMHSGIERNVTRVLQMRGTAAHIHQVTTTDLQAGSP